MGFLTKKRRRRSCRTSTGKICGRGFEYKYTLSRQGMKYVEWLQGEKMTEDFAYAKLTSEVLSYLPDELRDRLSMLSLAKAARRYMGPSRNTNLLDSNAVPVIHLSMERMRLRSEKEKLELANAIQKIKVENLERTVTNHEQQNASVSKLLVQALVWAVEHKNSADYYRDRFIQTFNRLVELQGPSEALSAVEQDRGDDASTAKTVDDVNAPFFDPRTGISEIPIVVKGTGISPFSLRTSWSEHYGNTYAVWETTPQGPGRILATWQINPESVKALVENRRCLAEGYRAKFQPSQSSTVLLTATSGATSDRAIGLGSDCS